MIRVLQFRFQTFFHPSALFPHRIALYFFNEMVHRVHNYAEQYHSSVRLQFILGTDCVLGVSPLEEPGLSWQCSCLSFSTDETSQQQSFAVVSCIYLPSQGAAFMSAEGTTEPVEHCLHMHTLTCNYQAKEVPWAVCCSSFQVRFYSARNLSLEFCWKGKCRLNLFLRWVHPSVHSEHFSFVCSHGLISDLVLQGVFLYGQDAEFMAQISFMCF